MAKPKFVLGFKSLADLIPEIIGEPLEDEYHAANGDGLQRTTNGLMVWRKADNWTAFTDGYRTWINGPQGLQVRLNTERFDWELPTPKPVLVRDIIPLLATAPWHFCPTRAVSSIEMIVVHWDGGPTAIPENYDPLAYYQWEARYHIAKDWGGGSFGFGLMYHEKISRDGRVWLTRPATHIVWAAMNANPVGYMICVDANEQSGVTPAQRSSLSARLDANRGRFQLDRTAVFGHGELGQYGNSTSCPGQDLLRQVQDYRRQT